LTDFPVESDSRHMALAHHVAAIAQRGPRVLSDRATTGLGGLIVVTAILLITDIVTRLLPL